MNGVLIIDKPAGLTSHDVVNRLRRILNQRSVGHLGTLDPLATGVLPLVTGNLTRLAQFYTASEKTYEGTIRFGFSTDTYDVEGTPTSPVTAIKVSLEELREAGKCFLGPIQQMPPPFSAKKIHGVPAYKLARKRKEVSLKPVSVEIKEFEITGVECDVAVFRAHVSSGTYMRSVAHDLGQKLGYGAHLQSLRRISVAEFDLSCARTLDEVEAGMRNDLVDDLFLHPRKLLPQFPAVTATEEAVSRIRTGRTVNLPELSRSRFVKVFYGQSELIAIASRIAGSLFHPKIVFLAQNSPQSLQLVIGRE